MRAVNEEMVVHMAAVDDVFGGDKSRLALSQGCLGLDLE